jgi:hypothetical protein
MSKTLHILNGDASAAMLAKSSIEGERVVWREMLCEGEVHNEVGSDQFWKIRYHFFEDEIGVDKLNYFDTTIRELVKLEDLSGFKTVILWFEYDLFCQVNLMALCAYLLKSYRKDIVYRLICAGKDPEKEELQSLSDYPIEAFESLLANSVKLSRHDLLFAKEAWHLYVENNREYLMAYDFNKSSKFKYFQIAINQHLKRFPGGNGLNQIENKILEIIDSGVEGIQDIVVNLLRWQRTETVYGFGDLQYEWMVKKMDNYYDTDHNSIKLNPKGRRILI